MTIPAQASTLLSYSQVRRASVLALLCALMLIDVPFAIAQTFTVLHEFTNLGDGGNPEAGLTLDRSGNLYGTTSPFDSSPGTVFKLSHKNAGWTLTTLHSFTGGADGSHPPARVVFGPDGKLYGTTAYDGASGGGTVFSLAPPPTVCRSFLCPWTLNVLHAFDLADGYIPGGGDLIFDRAGNLYGTTTQGGRFTQEYCEEFGCGVAYQLSPSNGGWSQTMLYQFSTGSIATPFGGVIMDSSGDLYGTAEAGGLNWGGIYQLTPGDGSWSQTVIYQFMGQDDGCAARAGLLADGGGNFFGATEACGSGNGGTVFELSQVGGNWVYNVIYSFTRNFGPVASLTVDAAGNLYGTAVGDGAYGLGSIFKLTPSNGSWTYTSLHDFTGGVDGSTPFSNVIFDAGGNLYGTASEGGTGLACDHGCGVVWEITP